MPARLQRALLGFAVATMIAWPATAAASVSTRVANIELGDTSEFDGLNCFEPPGDCTGLLDRFEPSTAQAYRGAYSVAPFVSSPEGLARGVWTKSAGSIDAVAGDEAWWGLALRLPFGFKQAMEDEVDFARLENYQQNPRVTTRLVIALFASDKRLRLTREQLSDNDGLATATTEALELPVPEIPVSSTEDFVSPAKIVIDGDVIECDGLTIASFTGCSGGSGAVAAGAPVAGDKGFTDRRVLVDSKIEPPEEEWLLLEAHQVFGTSIGMNELYVNGALTGTSDTPNLHASPDEFVNLGRARCGIVVMGTDNDLSLHADKCHIGPARLGVATMESGDFREFDSVEQAGASLIDATGLAFRGEHSARAAHDGVAPGGSWATHEVDWERGSEVWYGAAVRLPTGFSALLAERVEIMRWADAEGNENAVVFDGGIDSHWRLVRRYGDGGERTLARWRMPEGDWTRLQLRQRLVRTAGAALNEVWLDGRRVARSRIRNISGSGAVRIQYGIERPAPLALPLEIGFDCASVGRLGPSSTPPFSICEG